MGEAREGSARFGVGELPDVISASEGYVKVDIVGEIT